MCGAWRITLSPKNISSCKYGIMKIDHVALYCLNLEGMRMFFIRYFHGVSNGMYNNPKTGLKTYMLSFENSDARLELMTRPEVKDEEENIYRQGFIHLSFSVGSKEKVDCLTKALNEAGYQVLSGPRITGDGYYESCIVGPENLLLEITV